MRAGLLADGSEKKKKIALLQAMRIKSCISIFHPEPDGQAARAIGRAGWSICRLRRFAWSSGAASNRSEGRCSGCSSVGYL